MLAPFPSGQFEVRDVVTNHAVRYAGLRIAVTWKFVGSYAGSPQFGSTTGQVVEILGSSQFLVQDGRIVREVRVYDEVAVRVQINRGRGDGLQVTANIY